MLTSTLSVDIWTETNSKYGSEANVYWRSISPNDLSKHPLYKPLSKNIPTMSSSMSEFSQTSWQWAELHRGRLTTSTLAACLGFYETYGAEKLNVPNCLRGHNRMVAAWQHLRQKPPASWNHLFENTVSDNNDFCSTNPWSDRIDDAVFPFSHASTISGFEHTSSPARTVVDARLAWGSAQEATAVLVAVNYFAMTRQDVTVCECGMLVLEQHCDSGSDSINRSSDGGDHSDAGSQLYTALAGWVGDGSLPLIGASPDGLIHHSDGTVEVLEVKCVSPFHEHSGGCLKWCEKNLTYGTPDTAASPVAVWHVPQLQLEMLCAGPLCRSAVVVVLYVSGAHIFRVHRDDEYIASMMAIVKDFYVKFVRSVPSNKMRPPPINYHHTSRSSSDVKKYNEFLKATACISQSAVFVAYLKSNEIQRSSNNLNYFVS